MHIWVEVMPLKVLMPDFSDDRLELQCSGTCLAVAASVDQVGAGWDAVPH